MEKRDIESVQQIYYKTFKDLNDVLIGQADVKMTVTSALLCDRNSRVLFTGETGVGKTTLCNYLASGFNSERINVTSDLLPSEIQETLIKRNDINFLHIDEFNRGSGKLQSALMEFLEENQITVLGNRTEFGDFYVFATQNAADIAGVFSVPSASYDRFSVNIYFGKLDSQEKKAVLFSGFEPREKSNISLDDINTTVEMVKSFVLSKDDINLLMSAFDIIDDLQIDKTSLFGGSNIRAHQFAIEMAKINALADGRDYILPMDLSEYIVSLYLHRINQNAFDLDDSNVHSVLAGARKRILKLKK